MTFDAREKSVESGQPVELYTITSGAQVFYYTSTESDVTVAGQPYRAVAISRSDIREGSEERDSTLDITLPGSNIFVKQWVDATPTNVSTVAIDRYHIGDNQVVRIYQGKIKAVSWEGEGGRKATLAVEPDISSTSRPVPRFTYSGMCNHVLYDSGCKVDDTSGAFRFTGTLTVVDAANRSLITVPGLASFGDGWFTGGVIETQGGQDSRMILAHTGDQLTILIPFNPSPVGTSVTVLAGCAHDPTTCVGKFNNIINYGGFPFVPTINPFESGVDPNLCN